MITMHSISAWSLYTRKNGFYAAGHRNSNINSIHVYYIQVDNFIFQFPVVPLAMLLLSPSHQLQSMSVGTSFQIMVLWLLMKWDTHGLWAIDSGKPSMSTLVVVPQISWCWIVSRSVCSMTFQWGITQAKALAHLVVECLIHPSTVSSPSSSQHAYVFWSIASWPTVYAQVPQPPKVPIRALTATSANLTWSCPLEKNYTVTSYSVNVTVKDPSSIDADCVHGQNVSYYITIPGYQRYIQLKDMSLGKWITMESILNFKVITVHTVPFTSYSFEVLVNTLEGKGVHSTPRLFTTLQAPPTSPLNINASVLSYSSLLVSWSPPKCSNGIILGYTVSTIKV